MGWIGVSVRSKTNELASFTSSQSEQDQSVRSCAPRTRADPVTVLIAILGLPQAGKATLVQHLVQEHAFTPVVISTQPPPVSSSTPALHFRTSSAFLDYATRNWREDYVTTHLRNKLKLVEFAKRPFVVIVGVEAPLRVRWKRACQSNSDAPTLDEFVEADDLALYGPTATSDSSLAAPKGSLPPRTPQKLSPHTQAPPSPTPSPGLPASAIFTPYSSEPPTEALSLLLPLCTLLLPNSSSDPSLLTRPFSEESLPTLEAALRPGWDAYFMLLASLASLRSNCMKRRVGAVLVRHHRVVSTGYNGTPRGVNNCAEGGCGRCNSYGNGFDESLRSLDLKEEGHGEKEVKTMGMGEGLDECLCLHAEENALLEAGRERVSGGGLEGAVLYCNTCPCLRCTVKIVQCGVREVVYSLSYSMDASSRRVMEEAGVGLRQIVMPAFPRG